MLIMNNLKKLQFLIDLLLKIVIFINESTHNKDNVI